MPIYEYRCQKCAHEYEKREGFDAPAQQRCPKCRGKALRVLQAAPILFKGSGFYVTDNRKLSPTEGDSKESEDGASGASKDGASSASEDGASASSKDGAGASSKDGASAKSSDDSSKNAEPAATS